VGEPAAQRNPPPDPRAAANRLLHPAQLPAEAAADPLPRLRWLLGQLDGAIALTLSQEFVQQATDRFGWDFPRPPRTEADLYDLHQLRRLAQRLGLARRAGRTLTLTATGRRLVADPDRLWRATAAGLLEGNDFSVFAGELFLALLLGTGPVPTSKSRPPSGKRRARKGSARAGLVSHRGSMTSAGPSTTRSTCAAPWASWRAAATGPTAATSSPAPARPPPWKRCGPGPPDPGPSHGPDPSPDGG
jgi:hypothetical protein